MSQIEALIRLSGICEQSLRFDCFLAPLMSFANDSKGSWRDKNGTQRTVFHGNHLDTTSQPHLCQCGVNQTCVVPELACNCDAKLPVWQGVEGVITDKELLPITEFAYGPMKYDLEQAKVSNLHWKSQMFWTRGKLPGWLDKTSVQMLPDQHCFSLL